MEIVTDKILVIVNAAIYGSTVHLRSKKQFSVRMVGHHLRYPVLGTLVVTALGSRMDGLEHLGQSISRPGGFGPAATVTNTRKPVVKFMR